VLIMRCRNLTTAVATAVRPSTQAAPANSVFAASEDLQLLYWADVAGATPPAGFGATRDDLKASALNEILRFTLVVAEALTSILWETLSFAEGR